MASKRLPAVVRAYGYSIAIWCGLSLLTGWQYRIFDREMNIHSSFFDMVLLAESRGFSFALLTPPIFYIAQRYMGGARDRVRYVLGYALGVGPFMLLYACIRWLVLPPWDTGLQQYVPRTAHGPLTLIHQGFADQITMYIAIVLAAHGYQYLERVRRQEVERCEFQRALAASELQALKTQIHPHFLFNTLHGISTLIEADQPGAKTMVLKLSNLLRRTLEYSGSDLVPLTEELKVARDYLDLEKVRLGTRLRIDWLIEHDTQRILVPQLILQPLVENAVRHGIACAREGGWVQIRARRLAGKLELLVRNSTGDKQSSGTGVGLKNTHARLRYLYSDEASFSFCAADDHTATAIIVIPALGSNLAGTSILPALGIETDEGNHARIGRG